MATTIDGPLPDLTLETTAFLAIDAGDTSAVITRVVIHVSQEAPEPEIVEAVVPPLFAYGPSTIGGLSET